MVVLVLLTDFHRGLRIIKVCNSKGCADEREGVLQWNNSPSNDDGSSPLLARPRSSAAATQSCPHLCPCHPHCPPPSDDEW